MWRSSSSRIPALHMHGLCKSPKWFRVDGKRRLVPIDQVNWLSHHRSEQNWVEKENARIENLLEHVDLWELHYRSKKSSKMVFENLKKFLHETRDKRNHREYNLRSKN